ncbi:MAG: DTW domain-containing protein [Candidatus Sericytochromatia bacterium]
MTEFLTQNQINKKDPSKPWRGYKVIRCELCNLPKISCICSKIPKIDSKTNFILLMNEKEEQKPTNTGRLLTDTMDNSKLFIWSRVEPNKDLIELLENPKYDPYIVFPDDTEELKQRVKPFEIKSDKEPLFILLDGTWKQARKIYNKSEYLQKLPILPLRLEKKSEYKLRRASEENHLCTVETAIEILNIAGEPEQSKQLYDYFKIFTLHYIVGRSNNKHLLDE